MTLAELVNHIHGVGIEYNVNISGATSGRLASNPTYANTYTSPAGSSQPFNLMQPWGAFPIAIRY